MSGEVKMWDVTTGKETRLPTDYEDVVWSVAFSPDLDNKTLASASAAKAIYVSQPLTPMKMWLPPCRGYTLK